MYFVVWYCLLLLLLLFIIYYSPYHCRATVLVELGRVDEALPMYHEALRLFEEAELPSLESLREEIMYWSQPRSQLTPPPTQERFTSVDDAISPMTEPSVGVGSPESDDNMGVSKQAEAAVTPEKTKKRPEDSNELEVALALVPEHPSSPLTRRTPKKFSALSPDARVRIESDHTFDDSLSEFSRVSASRNVIEELSSPPNSAASMQADSVSSGNISVSSTVTSRINTGPIPQAAVPVTTLKDKLTDLQGRNGTKSMVVNTLYNRSSSYNGVNDNVVTPPRKSKAGAVNKTQKTAWSAHPRQFNTSATASGAAAKGASRRPAPYAPTAAAANAAALADIKQYKKSRAVVETTALIPDPAAVGSLTSCSSAPPADKLYQRETQRVTVGSTRAAPATSPISLRNPPLVAAPVTSQPASSFIQSLQHITGVDSEEAYKENSTSQSNVRPVPGVMQRHAQRQKQNGTAPSTTMPTHSGAHTNTNTSTGAPNSEYIQMLHPALNGNNSIAAADTKTVKK